MYYTDSCLYAFIQKAKQTSWWDSTLIVMVADHSTINPFDTPNWTPQRYEIPMLWVGGALKTTDTVITKVCSQVDIPHTVLAQLDVTPSKPYLFSQNILSSQAKPLAFCVYNNGVGAFTDTEKVTYDFDERQVKYSDNNNNDMLLRRNLAFMQYLYNSFMFIK